MSKFLKTKLSALLIGLMTISSLVSFADVQPMLISAPVNTDLVPTLYAEPVPTLYDGAVPTLYEADKVPFQVKQAGDAFTITLDENPTTGYGWSFKVNDDEHVNFISENYYAPETTMVGAGGQKMFTFKVMDEGVSTINFSYERAWENSYIETLNILVYKNGEKVFVEEDQIVTIYDETATVDKEKIIDMTEIQDGAVTVEMKDAKIFYNENEISTDYQIQVVDGITMIPLASVLRELDYKITWNGETHSVDIQKGAQWTSIKIGENAYFRNRMAPAPLSSEPIILEGYTYVPAEFFVEILGLGVQIDDGSFKINDFESTIHSGYITDISMDETGTQTITISQVKDSTDYMDLVVIHTSKAYTYYNADIHVGELIHVVSPMMMTMSIPPQTSGYIIYQ